MDWVLKFLTALIPPTDASNEKNYKWRVSVALAILFIGVNTVANTVFMFGLIPFLFSGFASVTTVQDLATKNDLAKVSDSLSSVSSIVKESQIETLDQQIYNLHVMECNALKAKNMDAADSHGRRLSELTRKFRVLIGYDYILRPCSEL
jgi:hypothetical protein